MKQRKRKLRHAFAWLLALTLCLGISHPLALAVELKEPVDEGHTVSAVLSGDESDDSSGNASGDAQGESSGNKQEGEAGTGGKQDGAPEGDHAAGDNSENTQGGGTGEDAVTAPEETPESKPDGGTGAPVESKPDAEEGEKGGSTPDIKPEEVGGSTPDTEPEEVSKSTPDSSPTTEPEGTPDVSPEIRTEDGTDAEPDVEQNRANARGIKKAAPKTADNSDNTDPPKMPEWMTEEPTPTPHWSDPSVGSDDLYTPDQEHVWVQFPYQEATLWPSKDGEKEAYPDGYYDANNEAYDEAYDWEYAQDHKEVAKAEIADKAYWDEYREAKDKAYAEALEEEIEETKKDGNYESLKQEYMDDEGIAAGDFNEEDFKSWYDIYYFEFDFDNWFMSKNDGKDYEQVHPQEQFAKDFDYDKWCQDNQSSDFDTWYKDNWLAYKFNNWFQDRWNSSLQDTWDSYWREENGFEKPYEYYGSSLPVYEVDGTWVRVSADGQPELWVNLDENGGNTGYIQGTYVITGCDTDYSDWNNPVDINIYDDNGKNLARLEYDTEIKVIGWEFNKWWLDDNFYHIEYEDANGNIQTGWIKTTNVKLKTAADKPHPAPTPVRPELNEDELIYAGETGDYSAIYAYLQESWGVNSQMPVQLYKLEDKEGHEFYVYCGDHDVLANAGIKYTKVDIAKAVEDADKGGSQSKYDIETLKKLNAIIQNGYRQGGGVDELVKKMIEAGCDRDTASHVTKGIALTATQAAIWYYTNEGLVDIENIDYGGWQKLIGYCYEGGTDALDDVEMKALKAVLVYLTGLEGIEPGAPDERPEDQTVKLDVNVKEIKVPDTASNASAQKIAENLSYNANVIFTISAIPTGWDKDKLTVNISVDGKTVRSVVLSQIDIENGDYVIRNVSLSNGQAVNIDISGILEMKLPKGIYVFTAEGGPDTSQTFIGMDSENPTYMINASGSGSLTFKVNPPKPTPSDPPKNRRTPDPTEPPTPDVTPRVTPTATPSATPTASASASPSASATPTASASATPSATPTASASASPSASATPTASASTTPSATPTTSASASPSASASATPTASASASPSASASATPTASASATPGASATPTPSATPDPRVPDSPDVITVEEEGVPRTYVKVWDPESEDWTYISEDDVPRALPDPNDADSPDKITIIDDEGVPKTYIKVADPDEEGEFVYILDDDVPLAAPETADASTILVWGGLCLTSVQGIVALWPRKKRKHKEEE